MTTVEEQLFELRKAIVQKRLKDVPQSTIDRELKQLKRMNFGSVTEFEEWVNETATQYSSSTTQTEPAKSNEVSPMMKEYIADRAQRAEKAASEAENKRSFYY